MNKAGVAAGEAGPLRLWPLLLGTLVTAAGLLLAIPDRAYACSCAAQPGLTPEQRAEEAFAASGAVFAGEVIGMDSPGGTVMSSADPVTVTFQTSEVWKGPKGKTLQVTTPRSSASCGYNFESGGEYIVYASEGMDVSLCSETKPLSDATADLNVLGDSNVLPDTSGVVPGPTYPGWVAFASIGVVIGVVSLPLVRRLSLR